MAVCVDDHRGIAFLALGAWTLTVGWFGFNVMSAQTIEAVSGLVTLNSLMAMTGGLGGVSITSQIIGTIAGTVVATLGGFLVYGILKVTLGIRLCEVEGFNGADPSIHRISASSR